MLIGIDASRVEEKLATGTENYSKELILSLANIDQKNNYRLYVKENFDPILKNLPSNFEIKVIKNKKFWTLIGLSKEMLKNPPDILFVPAHTLPIFTPKKTLVTIHDFAWKYFPEAYGKQEIRIQKLAISRAIKKRAKIIVYSKSTFEDLIRFYRPEKKNIFFVPMGFDSSKFSRQLNDQIDLEISQPYILSVGRLEKRKNTENLIRAYILLRQERKIKHKLILAGKPGYGYDEIKKIIDQSGEIKKDILELGYVDDKKLPTLYHNASVFVYPSLYEGFGFPILEAFAAGIPVVTSNTSSMPEVADKAAILINPEKPFEIAAAISQIINKSKLAELLTTKGKKQVDKYSWKNCAEETLKVITREE